MSGKRAKRERRVERRISQAEKSIYEAKLSIWESIKPPRWRIFKYRKWLKLRPKM